MLSTIAVPSRVIRSASHDGTRPPWSGKSACPERCMAAVRPQRRAGFRLRTLLLLVRQPAAGFVGLERVDGAVAFVYRINLAICVDHERGAVCDAHGGVEDAIHLSDLVVVIAHHREFRAEFFGPVGKGGYKVCAD